MSDIKQRLDQDLKAAMLAGNKDLVSVLRGMKSAILYEEVAQGKREQGLQDPEIIAVLQKELKKRQDSADLYEKGSDTERRDKELAEKEIITRYVPAEMSEEDLNALVEDALAQHAPVSPQMMGQIIGHVKEAAAGKANGARIAGAVRARMDLQ